MFCKIPKKRELWLWNAHYSVFLVASVLKLGSSVPLFLFLSLSKTHTYRKSSEGGGSTSDRTMDGRKVYCPLFVTPEVSME